MQNYYTVVTVLSIFSMMIIQVCIRKSNTLTRNRKRLFLELFNMIIIASICEWLGNYLQSGGSSTRIIHIIVKAIELSVAPSIAFLVAWMIEKRNKKPVYIYLMIHAVLEILSGKFGFIYYVDQNSTYIHGRFYWIYMMAYLISMIYCICVVLHSVKRYQYNGVIYFLLVSAFMVTGIVIQLCNNELKVDYITLAISAIMLYVFTLEMIYQTDELTELLNRRGYENYISHIDEKCVVIFFDVDHFKMINDTYGHAFGDVVLKTIGRTIREQYALYGKCFRIGGDEFAVILTKNVEKVTTMNEAFFRAMEANREKEKRLPYVSAGYSYYNPENQNIRDVIDEADRMMYQFKEKNREVNGENC